MGDRRFGILIVVAAAVVFSFNSLVFRGVDAATDWQFLTWRGCSVAIAMIIWLAIRHRGKAWTAVRDGGRPALIAGLFLAGSFSLFILAIARISVATTLFLQAASPVNAAIIGWIFLGERVRRETWIAIAVSAVGVVIMVGAGLGSEDGLGLLLALGLSVNLGALSVALRGSADADPAVVPLIGGLMAAAVAVVMAARAGSVLPATDDLLLAFVSGGVLLGLGLPFFTLGHRWVPAAEVTLILLVEVVLSPVWVWLWADEKPSTGSLVGGAVILSAVVCLAQTAGRERQRTAAQLL